MRLKLVFTWVIRELLAAALQDGVLQKRPGKDPPEPSILAFDLHQPPRAGLAEPAIPCAPPVEGRFRNAMPLADFRHLQPGFALTQDLEDLLLCEPALPHVVRRPPSERDRSEPGRSRHDHVCREDGTPFRAHNRQQYGDPLVAVQIAVENRIEIA